jgi:hypothetical protein
MHRLVNMWPSGVPERIQYQFLLLTYPCLLCAGKYSTWFQKKFPTTRSLQLVYDVGSHGCTYTHVFVEFSSALNTRDVTSFKYGRSSPTIRRFKNKNQQEECIEYLSDEERRQDAVTNCCNVECTATHWSPDRRIDVEWQSELSTELSSRATTRKILWYYDDTDKNGFAQQLLSAQPEKFFCTNAVEGVHQLEAIRKHSVHQGWCGHCIIVTLSRTGETSSLYPLLKCFTEGTLNSKDTIPHVVVLANSPPEIMCTCTTYDVRRIDTDGKTTKMVPER